MKTSVLFVCTLLLSACAGLFALAQKPEVSLASLSVLQIGVFEQRFSLKLRIQNPNDVDLPINGLSFDIQLNGQPFAHGLSDKAIIVRRYGEALLDVSATSTLGSALKQLRELQKSGRDRIDYRLQGRLQLQGMGSLPFEWRGDLQLPTIDSAPRRKLPPAGLERT
ncbi:MAG TPA: LEA type 2 family protein [Accumulibacter sp.]|jgi:LEA14-like dessication related protein|nr:LEA type 2 family protein [Accumulibacter sp.]